MEPKQVSDLCKIRSYEIELSPDEIENDLAMMKFGGYEILEYDAEARLKKKEEIRMRKKAHMADISIARSWTGDNDENRVVELTSTKPIEKVYQKQMGE